MSNHAYEIRRYSPASLSFYFGESGYVGSLFVEERSLHFEGDVDKSAQTFFAGVRKLLEQEGEQEKRDREIRNKALEEAAEYCSRHHMSLPCLGSKPTHDIYVEVAWTQTDEETGAKHTGLGYAAAIRALKDREIEENTIPRLANCGTYHAVDNTGLWHYINHAGTWQGMPDLVRDARNKAIDDACNTIERLATDKSLAGCSPDLILSFASDLVQSLKEG